MARKILWLRMLGEGALIVVSILLAFGIDAYWETRSEAAEEREVLVGLQADFEDLRFRLSQWATLNETGVRLLDHFLSDSLTTADRATADSALVLSVLTNVLDQGGPLEALFASGRLELIQNREIRARLGKWPDWLEDIHTNDLSRRQRASSNIVPHLVEYGWPDFDYWSCGSPPCTPSGAMPESYVTMAGDAQLRALLHMRKASMGIAVTDHSDRIPEVDVLLHLIRQELDTRWPGG